MRCLKMDNRDKNFVSAVVYIRNNEKLILSFLRSINEIFYKTFKSYEFILIDDCSTDNSIMKIKEFFHGISHKSTVTLVSMSYFQGVEQSMNAGIDLSIGDYIFEFDCINLDYDTSTIISAYKKNLEGYDIVGISPTKSKRISSILFYKLLQSGNKNIRNIRTESFRVVSRRAVNRIKSMNLNVPYRQIAYTMSGLKSTSICYDSTSKKSNKFTLNRSYRNQLAIDSLIVYTDWGYRVSFFFGFCALFNSFIRKIKRKNDSILLLFISFMFMIFAFILKYLSIIKELIFRKQSYVISNVEKLSNQREE